VPPTDLDSKYTIRQLKGWQEYQACVDLQRAVWGADFIDVVPASILKVSQRLGGVTAGAFDKSGLLVGFVFGITGVERGRIVHWSDMLGIRTEARDSGLGRKLKYYQRELLKPLGVATIYWTYDPLVSRNAYLNLMQFGVEMVEYVEDMYGPNTSSVLHAGIGSDRFIVGWHLDEELARKQPKISVAPLNAPGVPIINDALPKGSLPPLVRVAVPLHIDKVQAASLQDAAKWRASTRASFQWAIANGYRVTGFQRDDANNRGLYEVTRGYTLDVGR